MPDEKKRDEFGYVRPERIFEAALLSSPSPVKPTGLRCEEHTTDTMVKLVPSRITLPDHRVRYGFDYALECHHNPNDLHEVTSAIFAARLTSTLAFDEHGKLVVTRSVYDAAKGKRRIDEKRQTRACDVCFYPLGLPDHPQPFTCENGHGHMYFGKCTCAAWPTEMVVHEALDRILCALCGTEFEMPDVQFHEEFERNLPPAPRRVLGRRNESHLITWMEDEYDDAERPTFRTGARRLAVMSIAIENGVFSRTAIDYRSEEKRTAHAAGQMVACRSCRRLTRAPRQEQPFSCDHCAEAMFSFGSCRCGRTITSSLDADATICAGCQYSFKLPGLKRPECHWTPVGTRELLIPAEDWGKGDDKS